MAAYAVAHMRQVTMGSAVVEYLQRIDATLAPFGGRFIVHGGEVRVLEGSWPGHLIVIEFPDRGRASAWYNSDAYQQIVALRTDNSESDVIVVEGVDSEHKATDVLTLPGSNPLAPEGRQKLANILPQLRGAFPLLRA